MRAKKEQEVIPSRVLLTTREVSEQVGITPEAIKWAVAQGYLKCYAWTPRKLRLFWQKDVKRFIEWRAARLASYAQPPRGFIRETLTTTEAAKIIGVVRGNLVKAVRRQQIQAFDRLGNKWSGRQHCFFKRADVLRFIRERQRTGLISRVGKKMAYRTMRPRRAVEHK